MGKKMLNRRKHDWNEDALVAIAELVKQVRVLCDKVQELIDSEYSRRSHE